MAVALAIVGGVILVAAIGVPRIPWVIRDLFSATLRGDPVNGGVNHRNELLRDHPFPLTLAPVGYRIKTNEPIWDGEATLGWAVSFAGPDDEDSISYYTHSMAADGVYEYWRDATVGFAEAAGKEPGFLPVDDLGRHSFCEEGDDVFHEAHRVRCVAAFDGMAVIAESVNSKPERGSLQRAASLLRAGVEHWESLGA